ncbi:MAG: ribose-5-phosphate isomerase RpiA [Candidatus Protistobacter heckmanni]|nr:ribose-5-phosphate isomerase RpiA [Candidatus Protistobacter heckmanni]
MNQDQLKALVAQAAADYVAANAPEGSIIGVGTGSTANLFIDALAPIKSRLRGAVSSSEASSARLRGIGVEVFDLGAVTELQLYVDGADEIDPKGAMIKGGGGALTREKIVASVAKEFVCIADASKLVAVLGAFALPVEVIPMAAPAVARKLEALYPGSQARLRKTKDGAEFRTDNGCPVIDLHGARFADAAAEETRLNQIPGVVTVGLFAQRGANLLLVGTEKGVEQRRY